MTSEKEYLIYLLKCFLNNTIPEGRTVDWEEVFRLADINDIGAIISSQIKLLSSDYQPVGEIKSKFTQLIGYAVQSYEIKQKTLQTLCQMFEELNADIIFVKGAVIDKYYPVKEFRTSGDIDVIVRENEYYDICSKLKNENVQNKYCIYSLHFNHYTCTFKIGSVRIEVHRNADVLNDYFSDIFSIAEKKQSNVYELGGYDHLLYILLHFIKHIEHRGAGIRMIADIDVMIRHIDCFDEQYFYSLCEKAGKTETAKLILSYCNYCFSTPVNDIVFIAENTDLLDRLSVALIDGGSFGYGNETLGLFHFHYNNSKKVNFLTKLKTLFRYVFPPLQYVREYREYSMKYAVLIPFAYIGRIFDAVFKRKKTVGKTVKEIMSIKEEDLEYKNILDEFNLDNNRR